MTGGANVRLAMTLAALAAISVACRAQAEEAAARPAPGAGAEEVRLRLFAPAWRNIGEQKPQDAARKFTVIFGHLAPGPFHEGNRDAKCIKYVLGPYVVKALVQSLPPEALGRDRSGQVIKAKSWANWIVVPDNPQWIAHLTGEVRRLMDGDFDGLFTDSMGTAPIEGHYLEAELVNPATKRPYTKAEWLAAESVMLEAVARAMPKGKLLILNGLGPGSRYWTEPEADSPRVLLRFVQGAMSESIWRAAGAPLNAWPTPEQWIGDVRMVQDVERRGLMGFWWTKCWTDGNTSNNEPGAETLVPQWRRFALASYLAAAGPHSYFNFDTIKNDKPASNAAECFPEYDAPLGTALGPMQPLAKTGAYARAFSGGLVLVNPTARQAGGVEPPAGAPRSSSGEYTSWGENRTLRPPFALPAHAGLLLTPQ